MSAQRPLRSEDFSYEGSKEVEASGKIDGLNVKFDEQKEEKKGSVKIIVDPSFQNTKNFLDLFKQLKEVHYKEDKKISDYPDYDIDIQDFYDASRAWYTLKILMFNFITRVKPQDQRLFDWGEDDFMDKFNSSGPSKLKSFIMNVLTTKYKRLDSAYKDEEKNNALYYEPINLPFNNSNKLDDYEHIEGLSAINLIELKSIYDQIIYSRRAIETSAKDTSLLEKNEPPYLPKLTRGERNLLWNWIQTKQEALHSVYKDQVFVFATKVAGFINMSEFSIDKLITSAHKQKVNAQKYYNAMPPTIADDPYLSRERDLLFEKSIRLNQELEESKKKDIRDYQRTLNNIRSSETADQSEFVEAVDTMRYKYGAIDPRDRPKNRERLVAYVQEDIPESETTQKLKLHIEALKDLTQDFVSENSRKRMLFAAEWMMQPEITQDAELSPLFVSGMSGALMKVRRRCPKLRHVTNYEAFIKASEDVQDVFAELVSIQITRIQFFHPTRVLLDKTNMRNDQRENRLLYSIREFTFDGEKIISDLDVESYQTWNPALIAF